MEVAGASVDGGEGWRLMDVIFDSILLCCVGRQPLLLTPLSTKRDLMMGMMIVSSVVQIKK